MTDKTQKSKSKKKPKLSEEEKREKVRETLLKKKAYETRALALVEQLLETNIKGKLVLFELSQLPYLLRRVASQCFPAVEFVALSGDCYSVSFLCNIPVELRTIVNRKSLCLFSPL